MSFEYAKDKRTDNEVRADFDFGKQNEETILKAIDLMYYMVNDSDKFGSVEKYKPDAFVAYQGKWRPTEIKVTEAKVSYWDFKENQTDILMNLGGMFICSTAYRYCIISAVEVIGRSGKVENGYCNKPCYRLYNMNWLNYPRPITLIHKRK